MNLRNRQRGVALIVAVLIGFVIRVAVTNF